MPALPKFKIQVYRSGAPLPAEAEELFAPSLRDSRQMLSEDRWDRHSWSFALILAVAPGEHVLGGVHLDLGPIGGAGPLAKARLGYLERTFVRPEYRRQGLASQLLGQTLCIARQADCLYLRCSNNWDNEAERRLFLKFGFALVDLDGERDEEPCYLAVRPLQNL